MPLDARERLLRVLLLVCLEMRENGREDEILRTSEGLPTRALCILQGSAKSTLDISKFELKAAPKDAEARISKESSKC